MTGPYVWRACATVTCTLLLTLTSFAANAYDYQLSARNIAPEVYVVEGLTEDLTLRNGGNIHNSGFIVTSEGVIVIDAGPSKLYGEQLKALIAKTTEQPITAIFISHHHPDHFFGLQAFEGISGSALPQTIADLKTLASDYSDNMYRLIGNAMLGTDIVLPTLTVEAGEFILGDRKLQLYALSGHTESDLVIYDKNSQTLFAGDLVFNQRAPTTPHASIEQWTSSLDTLLDIPFKHLVPGHGPVSPDKQPIEETRDYINWLHNTLSLAAAQGLSMAEAMFLPIPEPFNKLAVIEDEYRRSVSHLYSDIEDPLLPALE